MEILMIIKEKLRAVLGGICVALLGFMSFLTCYQVFMRYIMRNPSTLSETILSYSFVWVSFLGAALVFGERDHMNLTFFLDMCSPAVKTMLSIFSELLIMATAVIVMLLGGKKFMDVGALQVSPTLGITMNNIYVIIPVSGVLIMVFSLINIVELITKYLCPGIREQNMGNFESTEKGGE